MQILRKGDSSGQSEIVMDENPYPTLSPKLQISFYYRLQEIRALYLDEALRETVLKINMKTLDHGLNAYVNGGCLKKVASFGIRGEIFFPVPVVIEQNPFLLGYYRLLFGLSQKEFYNKGPFGRFKRLEERGEIREGIRQEIPMLCRSLVGTGEILVEKLDVLSTSIVHDLQLLTLGPQLRGSENTRLGQDATQEIFKLIRSIVGPYAKNVTERTITIDNDSGRTVMVEFFSDPDVRVTEKLPSSVRPLVSMEIKGGGDASNIHNRLGEAEKSHQKAKQQGFFEFWTIARVQVDLELAKRASPTTSHFFDLEKIIDVSTKEHKTFRELLASHIGIRTEVRRGRRPRPG